MFEYNYSGISFKCHETMDGNKILLFDGHPLDFTDGSHFLFQDPALPFNADKDEIEFSADIKEICFKFFEMVKKMYEDGVDERPSSILVATLFEKFAGYWKHTLLCHHREKIGIKFWKKILILTLSESFLWMNMELKRTGDYITQIMLLKWKK